MLMKLALSGMKSRRRDYIVLFSGLIFSVAIFYMFETIAMNKAFIQSTSSVSVLPIIFHLGSVLLAIITLVYIIYANSFLLSLRQREFGMYMMLGARKNKITQIMFGETLLIGVVAIMSGLILGTGLSAIVSHVLMQALSFQSHAFTAFYVPSIVITVLFFTVLFFVSSVVNAGMLSKMKLINLLKGGKQTERKPVKKVLNWGMFGLAILLLVAGYLALYQVGTGDMKLNGVGIALVTIPVGTYLTYATLVPRIIAGLRHRQHTIERGLTGFTYGQIEFRMTQYSRMLAVVTMLLALALGSVTVGLGFKSNADLITEKSYYYDAVLQNPNGVEKKLLSQTGAQTKYNNYRYKVVDHVVYYQVDDLMKNIPTLTANNKYKKPAAENLVTLTLTPRWEETLMQLYPYYMQAEPFEFKLVDVNSFNQLQAEVQVTRTVKSADFNASQDIWRKIDQIEIKKNHIDSNQYYSRYANMNFLNELSKGTEFMGFFLGVSFLAMMASTLMFKILSGASDDIRRYEMLNKIGAQRSEMAKAIAKEIGYLFILPAILGLIHVVFGLQMFKVILLQPYYHFWIPVMLLGVIYAIYYMITVWLYRSLVLGKQK
ncbi:ABC transporter permease [Weissella diestrammenae]|uniref:ABC transporter permease n=1 Tax=Weissella diestrammenae TaxID=1162633 RepID=A0A7G9T4E1_9LACO|nr:ABC transporter permease [Weissella diestrammenae]MCM0583502.1 ABC transporter permease [Weissella diestrammenae]QNN74966.1 ABC transporter permease [Weissella diestrammenae]